MRSSVQVLLLSVIFVSTGFALEEPHLTPVQMERYNRLTHELIAPCCWRETIAIHRSEVALQMLDEIEQLVAEGRSEEEIKSIYVSRYGPRILADPPGNERYWLYVIPFALLASFILAGVVRLRSLVERSASPQSLAQPEVLAQVRKETENLF